MQTLTPTQFQRKVLHWYDQSGRKDLPWQKNKSPYRVWVSEIMLQQTQVGTVISYFERFIKEFPTLHSLANATEDEVLHLWTGLGYYSRARNLHKSAKIIIEKFQGIFPSDSETLQSLPGIGRSTAGAILALAMQQKAAILDGNVKRVLTRLYGIREWPGDPKTSAILWGISDTLTPQKRIADYTQAMMDIGATLCIRGKPKCNLCPFISVCVAKKKGIEQKLPVSKPKKTLPIRTTTFLIFENNQKTLLEKRPAHGIWGGLWSLPEITGIATLKQIKKRCRDQSIFIEQIKVGDSFRHTFTHFHLDILPVHIILKGQRMAGKEQIWYNLQDPLTIGLPAPVKRLLGTYHAHGSVPKTAQRS